MKSIKERIIWWIQFIINELFMIWFVFFVWDHLEISFGSGGDTIIAFFLVIIALCLGYALTVKFENE